MAMRARSVLGVDAEGSRFVALSDRNFALLGVCALVAAGLAASPALSAADHDTTRAQALSAIAGRFTPATGEPALLARFAQLSAEARRDFHFTPAMTRSTNRAVTLVRRVTPLTMTSAANLTVQATSSSPTITITPVSYRLGSAVGYTAFTTSLGTPAGGSAAVTGTAVNIATLPQARAPVDPTERPSRFGADMRLENRTTTTQSARAAQSERAMAVDVSGSYRLQGNIDLTAGVRLQRESDRLTPLTSQQQDSQAVYVGTRFRF